MIAITVIVVLSLLLGTLIVLGCRRETTLKSSIHSFGQHAKALSDTVIDQSHRIAALNKRIAELEYNNKILANDLSSAQLHVNYFLSGFTPPQPPLASDQGL